MVGIGKGKKVGKEVGVESRAVILKSSKWVSFNATVQTEIFRTR